MKKNGNTISYPPPPPLPPLSTFSVEQGSQCDTTWFALLRSFHFAFSTMYAWCSEMWWLIWMRWRFFTLVALLFVLLGCYVQLIAFFAHSSSHVLSRSQACEKNGSMSDALPFSFVRVSKKVAQSTCNLKNKCVVTIKGHTTQNTEKH